MGRMWGYDRTRGSFVASVAFTSATVATSAGLLILSMMGKPRKSVDLPVAEMVSVVIVICIRARNSLGPAKCCLLLIYYLFIRDKELFWPK
jgi:type IV secretory pathway VirB2 component (pilin)